jgi:2-amino-4-hydroxy-6-hydroxymethyldihydropteridine diphosphokinase
MPPGRAVYISLGSNLGHPPANLAAARERIAHLPGVEIGPASSVYYTEPQGVKEQPWFANQVLKAFCGPELGPGRLLSSLLGIETEMGRHRDTRWGPRVIDLDLLFFGDVIVQSAELVLPHPRVGERAFILVPLLEIAPGFVLPGGAKARDLLQALDFRLENGCIWQDSGDRGQGTDDR